MNTYKEVDLGSFGGVLRQLRKSSGLTLQQVADLIDVDMSTVSKWENCKRTPKITDYVRLVHKLGGDIMILYH